jgi:hypothetical protein
LRFFALFIHGRDRQRTPIPPLERVIPASTID